MRGSPASASPMHAQKLGAALDLDLVHIKLNLMCGVIYYGTIYMYNMYMYTCTIYVCKGSSSEAINL